MIERDIVEWNKMVVQSQKNMEGDAPAHEDILVIRVDVWISSLLSEIRMLKYAEDIRLSRTMTVQEAEKLAIEQIAKEELTKGNV